MYRCGIKKYERHRETYRGWCGGGEDVAAPLLLALN